MDEQRQALEVRHRRSREEIQELLARFESSGLTCVEFCRTQGVSLASLVRYRKLQATRNVAVAGSRLVVVEVNPSWPVLESAALAVACRAGVALKWGVGSMRTRWYSWSACWSGSEHVGLGSGHEDLFGGGSHGHAQGL